jgi:uroporphyrinogen decarboxylase
MGLENVSVLVYDDPALFGEMVKHVADCVLGVLERAYAEPIRFDYGLFWEDMCYNHGPLISPAMFREFLLPQYRRITSYLREHGTDVVVLDCDGKIDELVPMWLEGGVNCLFPIEVGTWGGDPVRFRAAYGPELLMMGGISKLALAGTHADISAAVEHVMPLVEEKGFIPFADHRVPPDVPLANYLYYIERVRERVAGNVNLKPMGEAAPNPDHAWIHRFDWDHGH